MRVRVYSDGRTNKEGLDRLRIFIAFRRTGPLAGNRISKRLERCFKSTVQYVNALTHAMSSNNLEKCPTLVSGTQLETKFFLMQVTPFPSLFFAQFCT